MDKLVSLVEDIISFFSGNGIASLLGGMTGAVYKEIIRIPADGIMSSPLLAELYSCIIPVGLILIVIAFFQRIMEMAIDDNLNPDKIIKEIILLVIVLMVMDNAVVDGSDYSIGGDAGWIQKIYHWMTDITDDVWETATIEGMAAGENSDSEAFNAILDAFDSVNPDFSWTDILFHIGEVIWDLLTSALMMLGMAFLSAIMSVVVFCVAVYRAIKIGIYIILSPVGMAVAYDKGNIGLGYFKKLLALFLQELVIIVSMHILFLAAQLNQGMITFFVLTIVMVTNIVGSERKAKELIA